MPMPRFGKVCRFCRYEYYLDSRKF